jgi:5-formyltetrahydrofolate cyclo-ligase
MSLSVAELKQRLRLQVQGRLAEHEPEEIARVSLPLCAHLRAQPLWQAARSILGFIPLAAEPDIRPLLGEALAAGKALALPRFDPARRAYDLRVVRDLDRLRPGHFGIEEPEEESPLADSFRLDFALVPGLAFDLNGRRLGRGRGYFDRILTQVGGHKCGVAFDWQVVPEVPVQPHDIWVDSLLTPTRWFGCQTRLTVL